VSSPELTAVIPTYNRPELLQRAVASAVRQNRVALEVIVVDDGSTRPVTPAELPDGVIVARTGGSGGVASARNLGVERARAPWIAFLDDDDWWAPDHAHRLQSVADRTNAGFAYSATWDVDLANSQAVMRPAPCPTGLVSQLLRENAIGTPSCVMIDRALYRRLGGFDRRLSVVADWDLWLRLAQTATGAVSRAPTVAYAAHADNMSLDLPRLLNDFNRLSLRYVSLCEQEGIRFGEPGFSRWMAQLHRRQGRRRSAAAWYLRSARVSGRRLDVMRALGVLLGENAMRLGRRDPAVPPVIPSGWLSGRWSDVRSEDLARP
jgi:glycosyltransferase involved in cell wall biosynthesis